MSIPRERTDIKVSQERAVLVAVHLPSSRFDERDPLGELRALAETAGASVVGELVQRKQRPESGTYLGTGKLEELKLMCDELKAGIVVFDNDLTPSQMGNIEKVIERKVVDRSELILDIFAGRATTREAKLQVELAQLEYTYPRLRAMWDHLERIVGVGGIGGIGTRGPGEQQLEIDRRLVQRRVVMLKRELAEVQARKAREVRDRNIDHLTIGIVGYTNAGKSTLFNTLTSGGAFANDQLFATLITRTRGWPLDRGVSVMLSDTVGFVRDLPHNLVASFRATLEEATHAHLLLIVLDVSDPSAELQYETVQSTLEDLFEQTAELERKEGITWQRPEQIVLLNKADKLRDNSLLLYWQSRVPGAIPFSAAQSGEDALGHDILRRRVLAMARGPMQELNLTLPLADSRSVSQIEQRAEVLDRTYDDGHVTIRARIGERQLAQLRAGGARIHAEPANADPSATRAQA